MPIQHSKRGHLSGCYKIIGFVPFNFNTVLNGLNAVVLKKDFILPSLTVHVVCFIDHLTC